MVFKPSSSSSSVDSFGTYLSEIRGSTLMEKILARARAGSVTIGDLVKQLDGNPQDVVAAIVKAEDLGFIRLDKQGDDTVITPLGSPTPL
jgi:phage gp45-like